MPMGASGAHRKAGARSVATGRQGRSTGWECNGRSRRTCDVRRVHGNARQCLARRSAWHAMATKLPGRTMGVHQTALVRVQKGASGRASHATPMSNRRANASLRGRTLHCGRCQIVSHGHQRRRAAWGCTSVATAAASACGGKTNRRFWRLLGGESASDGGSGAEAAGRTSTGATCAISASKRGSSGAQATPLYMQRPLANTSARSFHSPRSNRR